LVFLAGDFFAGDLRAGVLLFGNFLTTFLAVPFLLDDFFAGDLRAGVLLVGNFLTTFFAVPFLLDVFLVTFFESDRGALFFAVARLTGSLFKGFVFVGMLHSSGS
jgi:hypothetical protein